MDSQFIHDTENSKGVVSALPTDPIGKHAEHPQMVLFRENVLFIFVATLIYAAVFVFARYKNRCGLVTPLYPIGSIIYLLTCARKLGAKWKKGSGIPCAALVILGINLCTTVDPIIVFLDFLAIFLLTVYLAFHLFYEDKEWGFMKYVSSILLSNMIAIEHWFAIPIDLYKTFTEKDKGKRIPKEAVYIMIGLLITLPILPVILILLGTADYFFGKFLNSVILDPIVNFFSYDWGFLFIFFIVLIGAYAFVKMLCRHLLKEEVKEVPKNPAIIAVTVNIVLGIIYVIFSGFQIFTLFLGQGTLPDNYTYASYAREGFFQLVVVCLFNMILVLICVSFFKESKLLNACLTVICACTYVMIASSAYRMFMYVQQYQLTYTRVFVFWALIVIFAVMCGIVVFIYKRDFKLFQYCMIALIILYIGYAYSRPEYIIAKNNLSEKYYTSSTCQGVDYSYLSRLSLVATPAIAEAYERGDHDIMMEKVIDAHWRKYHEHHGDGFHIRKANLSVYLAWKSLPPTGEY